MGVSKVEFGGDTLIDLTEDSVTPETLAEGETAHNAAGEEITGTLKVQDEIVTTTGTGSFYKANVKGITELKPGVSFVMIPHTVSTSSTPLLVVNNLTAKIIKRMGVNSTLDDMSISDIPSSEWIKPSRAYRVMYNNGFWYLVDFPRPSAKDLIDNVPVEKGGVPSTNADNKGKVLTTNDSGIPEWQEPTGGEIDTSTLATVDKVKSIDTYYEGVSQIDASDGITWKEGFEFNDGYGLSGNTIASGSILHRVPIVAGDNVTFTVDEENQLVKINATGGGSGGSPENAVLTMPIIRFANVQDFNGAMRLTEDNPFTFTVEIVGGGELKEGDLLQICVRRKYWYKDKESEVIKHKWKLRKVAQREITAEDFGKRFLSINVTLANVESRGNWLFRNDRKPLRVDGTIDTHSYMYFRIKRVTQYGSNGEQCNAIFSNVEKVAKTYAPHTKHLTIK